MFPSQPVTRTARFHSARHSQNFADAELVEFILYRKGHRVREISDLLDRDTYLSRRLLDLKLQLLMSPKSEVDECLEAAVKVHQRHR
jgi:hypothetical protein